MGSRFSSTHILRALVVAVGIGIASFSLKPTSVAPTIPPVEPQTITEPSPVADEPPAPIHQAIPAEMRGVYLTGWSAGTSRAVARTLDLVAHAGINTVVIDIKDATGKISYQPQDPELVRIGAGTNRIRDIGALIDTFHQHGVYVIGRVQVFQDPFFATKFPEEAFHTTTGDIWRDNKGIAWLRPNSTVVWDYIASIARDAYGQGFDEINIDYVRFPSDGNLKAIDMSSFSQNRVGTMTDFFTFVDTEIRGKGIPVSADIFGLTLSATGDLGIGQELEAIAPYVDYVCPMIYPSHFWEGSFGFAKPAEHPYEIITRALSDGIAKLTAANIPTTKLRPWLQAFDLGALYTPAMVQAQVQATTDLGITSWLFWDPKNLYSTIPRQ